MRKKIPCFFPCYWEIGRFGGLKPETYCAKIGNRAGVCMRRISAFLFFLLTTTALLHAASISGDYVESRSADVYVAQCFANGEAGLVGDQAMLAWHIRQGSWQGQKLDGLTVVAAVKAKSTLGDPYH